MKKKTIQALINFAEQTGSFKQFHVSNWMHFLSLS